MKTRAQTLIHLLLALVLLAQSLAVAAAPRGTLPLSSDTTAAQPETHCPMHREMRTDMDKQAGKSLPSCCDESCPDMTTCALGHLSLSNPVSFSAFVGTQIFTAELFSASAQRTSGTLLRPPIAPLG